MPAAVVLAGYMILARLALVGVMSAEYILAAVRNAPNLSNKLIIPVVVFFFLIWCAGSFDTPGRDCEPRAEALPFAGVPKDGGWDILFIGPGLIDGA
ncbi:hypothetical protein HWV62_22706 [Athelia sp. TMB]|nr:hypothetical protein HWV62_22706 [Athelia sp. TMB]